MSPIRTFEDGVAQTLSQRRFTSVLLTMFAGFGLGLGALGVYGVLAYTVAERRQEIGLRRALGAPGARVLLLVLSQGLTPVLLEKTTEQLNEDEVKDLVTARRRARR